MNSVSVCPPEPGSWQCPSFQGCCSLSVQKARRPLYTIQLYMPSQHPPLLAWLLPDGEGPAVPALPGSWLYWHGPLPATPGTVGCRSACRQWQGLFQATCLYKMEASASAALCGMSSPASNYMQSCSSCDSHWTSQPAAVYCTGLYVTATHHARLSWVA